MVEPEWINQLRFVFPNNRFHDCLHELCRGIVKVLWFVGNLHLGGYTARVWCQRPGKDLHKCRFSNPIFSKHSNDPAPADFSRRCMKRKLSKCLYYILPGDDHIILWPLFFCYFFELDLMVAKAHVLFAEKS